MENAALVHCYIVHIQLTIHKQLKVLSITGCHSIPIGGHTGVGTGVSIHGVGQGQVATHKEDIPTISWAELWHCRVTEGDSCITKYHSIPHPGDLRWWDTSG